MFALLSWPKPSPLHKANPQATSSWQPWWQQFGSESNSNGGWKQRAYNKLIAHCSKQAGTSTQDESAALADFKSQREGLAKLGFDCEVLDLKIQETEIVLTSTLLLASSKLLKTTQRNVLNTSISCKHRFTWLGKTHCKLEAKKQKALKLKNPQNLAIWSSLPKPYHWTRKDILCWQDVGVPMKFLEIER